MKGQMLFYLAVVAGFFGTVRFVDVTRGRRAWRNGRDPEFQGDGWRWTLSLMLPDLLLYRSSGVRDPHVPKGYPVTVKDWPLTREQRQACVAEWLAAQAWYAAHGRPRARWE